MKTIIIIISKNKSKIEKFSQTCLLKHEMALSTEGTESVCGEYAFPPLLFTHSFIYSAIYHSTNIHIIYLVFIIFYLLFCILCVFYDSINALIVYVLFRAITYTVRVYILSIKDYKVCHSSDQSLEG